MIHRGQFKTVAMDMCKIAKEMSLERPSECVIHIGNENSSESLHIKCMNVTIVQYFPLKCCLH